MVCGLCKSLLTVGAHIYTIQLITCVFYRMTAPVPFMMSICIHLYQQHFVGIVSCDTCLWGAL